MQPYRTPIFRVHRVEPNTEPRGARSKNGNARQEKDEAEKDGCWIAAASCSKTTSHTKRRARGSNFFNRTSCIKSKFKEGRPKDKHPTRRTNIRTFSPPPLLMGSGYGWAGFGGKEGGGALRDCMCRGLGAAM